MTPKEAYERLLGWARELASLHAATGLLHWDMQTKMPPRATPYRGEVVAFLAGEIHRRRTRPEVGEWLEIASGGDFAQDPLSPEAVNLRWWKISFERSQKYPEAWVKERARLTTEAVKVWEVARRDDDFSLFAPYLERLVEMAREEAEFLGYEEDPYDALLELYEPGMTTRRLWGIFAPLAEELPQIIQGLPAFTTDLRPPYPAEAQREFILQVYAQWGLDPEAFRLDTTVHPFFTRITPGDLRITTRFSERDFREGLFGALHEAGHAQYDRGLPTEHWGTPRGASISHGIHESQSRFWENLVGRNPAFWEFFYPLFQKIFPQHGDTPLEVFLQTVNEMRPSLIRVDADEVTYNLHIFLRFELEHALINQKLTVQDLPGAWNDRFKALLGIEVPSNREGVLQDIHWSQGSFGYFPTYALGNIYGAAFFAKLREELLPEELFRRGEFLPIYEWLQKNIYVWGKTFMPEELVQRVTGKPVSAEPLLQYVREKIAFLETLRT